MLFGLHKKYAGFIVALVFLSLSNFTQAQQFIAKPYSFAEGFKSSSIQNIFTDSHGYLWISTYSDLLRFDGTSFIKLGAAEGLTGNLNAIFFEDSDKRLWGVSGNGKRNVVICYCNGKFSFYAFNKTDSVGFIFSFYETPGKIICACSNRGVFALQKNHFTKVNLGIGEAMYPVRDIIRTKTNSLILCTPNYILEKSADRKIKIIADTAVAAQFNTILPLGNDILIIASNRLLLYDFHSLKNISGNIFKSDFIISAAVDDKHGIYASGIDSGLLYFYNNSVQHIYTNENFNLGFVSGIAEDREKNIWIGSLKLYRLNADYINHFTKSDGLEGTDTRSVFFTKSGTGYFGQTSFTVYDGKKFTPASELLSKNDIAKFPDHIPYFLQDDDKGRLWMMLNPSRLFRYSNHMLEDLTPKFNPQRQGMGQIKFDAVDSSIYIALDSIIQIKNDSIIEKIALPKNQYSGKPLSLCFDDKHRLWVGTTGGNFGYINLQTKKFYAAFDKAVSQTSQKIICANDGTTWMANTGYGIYHYTITPGNKIVLISHITEQNDLPSNSVWDIVFDKQNFLWASTSDGLIRYKIITDKGKDSIISSHVFDINDGINAGSFVDSHLAVDTAGNTWLTTYDGVYRINPNNILYDSLSPLVHIEKIGVLNDSSNGNNYAKSSDIYFNTPINPVLPYDKNSVTIYFNSIAFAHRDEIECEYKLQGLSDNWIKSSPTSNASYINLPAGNYTFHVRARRKNFAWSKEATFAFTIKTPYWQTWWFRLLIILLASSILIIAFRIRIQQINRKVNLEQQMRQLEMQALKARMNPHFIYNAMNSIQSLIVSNEQESAVRYLGKFAKLLRQVLENSDQQLIYLERELSSLQLYIELETLRLNIDFDYSIIIEKNIDAEDELIPPLILQPYVENALWHGLSNKQGFRKLSVNIYIDRQYLAVIIEDNGIGRAKSAEIKSRNTIMHNSKGLTITERRLSLLSKENAELITIHDLTDEQGNAAGTKVFIKIPRQLS